MSSDPSGRGPSGLALGVILFGTALCSLLLEILLTRVLSVVMWYHFTFAVVSVSMLGIAAGSMWFYLQHGSKSNVEEEVDFWELSSTGLSLFGFAAAMPVGLMLIVIGTPTFSWKGLILLTLYFLACAAPFVACGYVTSAAFRFGSKRVSLLYGFELVGAAIGCLVATPALTLLGGVGSLLLVSVLTCGMATYLAFRGQAQSRRTIAGLGLATFVILLGIHVSKGTDLRTVKLSGREEFLTNLDVKWNSHSRLAVLDYFDPDRKPVPGKPDYPFLSWGLSTKYTGYTPPQYLITIDGGSETPMTRLKDDIEKHEYLSWDVTSLPYHLRPGTKTLVIGAGGGRDLLTSYYFGSKDITGVELNQGIVDWVQGKYADFTGDFYRKPEVKIVVDDGRNFTRSSKEKYEVLQISMIDTFAATSAGAYTLAENNLYTAEALDAYLEHLTDTGILSINRYFLQPPQQSLRIATLGREALERTGVKRPQDHVIVAKQPSVLGDNGLVMIAKQPFTPADVAKAREVCESRGFEIVALPGETKSNPFADYLASEDPQKFCAQYDFDIRPSTDDWPFFFNTMKADAIVKALTLRSSIEGERVYNYDATFILFVLLGLSVLSLAFFVFLPLAMARRKAESPSALPGMKLPYFVLIGLGFILFEVVLIQRFNLYLGHPAYSLSVILVTILFFSGVGAAWTSRWSEANLGRSPMIACAIVVVFNLLHQAGWPVFLAQTLGLPLSTRIALTVLSLAPIGIAMGMPYPLGLRAVSATHPDGLPWVWAVNAAASVLGSIAAFAIAMMGGFQIVLSLSIACYALALISAPVLARKPA